VWYDSKWGATEAVYRSREKETWGQPYRLSSSPAPTYFASIAAGDDGSLHAIFQDRQRGNYDVYYRRGEIAR